MPPMTLGLAQYKFWRRSRAASTTQVSAKPPESPQHGETLTRWLHQSGSQRQYVSEPMTNHTKGQRSPDASILVADPRAATSVTILLLITNVAERDQQQYR
mmetsp:Transcript_5043/g.9509  ORF Transcript_5043/g.9509 Transcript_5043/m.9509 type:complete len:101 (+) Transcript_5043:752-1054(+)